MNIYEVAKKAGVSTATISRVLNNAPGVSPLTRAKVKAIMEACDYQPNAFARGLGLNSMSTIGLMCADAADHYLARAVSCLEKELRERGYDCFLCCTGRNWADRKKCTEMVLSRRVDGIVLVGSHFVHQDMKKNAYIRDAAGHVPVVLLGATLDIPNVYSVLCDDRDAMERVTGLMLDGGKRQLVYLYDHASFSGKRKLEGFMAAHEKRGLIPREEAMIHLLTETDPITAARQALEALTVPFDGVVASEDAIAAGALKYAAAHGLSVPGQIAVSGYNDSELARACTPELTSVDNKVQSVCARGIEVLMSALKKEDAPRQTVFAAGIAEREST